eukprot:797886-Prorocentrum_minimum.AAC.1
MFYRIAFFGVGIADGVCARGGDERDGLAAFEEAEGGSGSRGGAHGGGGGSRHTAARRCRLSDCAPKRARHSTIRHPRLPRRSARAVRGRAAREPTLGGAGGLPAD